LTLIIFTTFKNPVPYKIDPNYKLEMYGTLPSEVAGLTSLTTLKLGRVDTRYKGNIRGTIPTALSSLTHIWITYTELGGIFDAVEYMPNLKSLQFFNNPLSNGRGAIPSSLGLLNSLTELWIQGNGFSGEIPDALCQVENIDIKVGCGSINCTCCSPSC